MAGRRASNAGCCANEEQGWWPQDASTASAGAPSFASGCPLALLGHRHTILSRCVRENEERPPSRVAYLSLTSATWVLSPLMLGRDSRFLRWWMRWRLGMLCCLSGATLFLRKTDPPEDGPQDEVVGRFERSCQDEGQSEDEQGTLKQQAGEDRAGGRAQAASPGGHAGRRCARPWVHQGHRVGRM